MSFWRRSTAPDLQGVLKWLGGVVGWLLLFLEDGWELKWLPWLLERRLSWLYENG